jgi:hypothetical protein
MPCSNCNKFPPEIPTLKQCAKCKTAYYCSRECQTKHWKKHKKECVVFAAAYASHASGSGSNTNGASNGNGHPRTNGNSRPTYSTTNGTDGTSSTPMAQNLNVHFDNPFSRLRSGTWLDGRSESDVQELLIDTYRLRMSDRFKFEKVVESDSALHGFDGMIAERDEKVLELKARKGEKLEEDKGDRGEREVFVVEGGRNSMKNDEEEEGEEQGEPNGVKGFRYFLETICEARNRFILPHSWNRVKREACS